MNGLRILMINRVFARFFFFSQKICNFLRLNTKNRSKYKIFIKNQRKYIKKVVYLPNFFQKITSFFSNKFAI